MIIFGETVKPMMVLGILFSLLGPFLTFIKEETGDIATRSMTSYHGKEFDRRTLCIGMLYGMGGTILWGSSAIFIKLGLEKGGSTCRGKLDSLFGSLNCCDPHIVKSRK